MAAQLSGMQYKKISPKRALCVKFLPNTGQIGLEVHAEGACGEDHENGHGYANGQKKSPAKINRFHVRIR